MSVQTPAATGGLTITGLAAGYFGAPVVRDINLHVEPGEVVLSTGPSAGDAAALRALYGDRQPDAYEGALGNNTIATPTPLTYLTPGTFFAAGLSHPVVADADLSTPTDRDIYPTKSWDADALLQPESRAAFRRLLAQGWTDAVRRLHPEAPMFSFWDYKRNRWPRDAGLRLDHILLAPALSKHLVDAGVDRAVRGQAGASDHAPAWAVLAPPRP